MNTTPVFRSLLAAAILTLALAAGCSSEPASSGSATPEAQPQTAEGHWTDALSTLDTDQVRERIAAAKGRPVLVCLWSVNCPACVQELPVLEELADQYAPDDLEVLLLNLDGNRAVVRGFFKEYEPAATVLLVEPSVADAFQATYIPKLVLYDASGEKVFDDSGFYPKGMLEALIQRASGE